MKAFTSCGVVVSSADMQTAEKALTDPLLPKEFTLEDFQAAFDRANAPVAASPLPENHPLAEIRGHGRGCKCAPDRLCENARPGADALVDSFTGAALLGEAIHEKRQQLGGDYVKGQLREAIATCRSIAPGRAVTFPEPAPPSELAEALQHLTPMDPAKLAEEQRAQGNLGKRALDQQVGGRHYKDLVIQPVEYCQRNGLGFCESSVVKYVTRYKSKAGVEDLRKARHFLDLLIEMTESDAKKATYCDHAQTGYDA